MNLTLSNRMNQARAWFVHLYTSLGLAAALLALIAIFNGNLENAFAYLGIALFIDATDGTLARAWKVTVWAPQFDGRKLDDITDYINYGFLPLFMLYRFNMVEGSFGVVTLAITLIAASYGFCQKAAKTNEGYFTGFPNFWNVVVFYMFLLRTPPTMNAIVLLVLAFLVFVPMEFVSFSTRPFRRLTFVMAGLYGLALFYLVLNFHTVQPPVVIATLIFPVYYIGISAYLFVTRRLDDRRLSQEA